MYRQVTRMRMAMISAAALGVLGATWVSDPGAAAQARQPAPVASVGAARPPASPGGTLCAAVRRALGGPTAPAASAIQRTRLTASDAHRGSNFGNSVAISGDTAVVGAWGWPGNAVGAAYVFVRSGTGWSQQAKLTAADGGPGDAFGDAVSISKGTALVGAFGKDYQTGAAYVFVHSGATWSQQAKLTAADAARGAAFGWSVATTGSTALIGAGFDNSKPGAAYVFTRSQTAWSQRVKLVEPGAGFGSSVAISGPTAVVGVPYPGGSTGAAWVFAGV